MLKSYNFKLELLSFFLILFSILSGVKVMSQDIHFSQYTNTPALVNPALTAAFNNLRATIIYKNQWMNLTVPYKTYGATFESKIKPGNWDKLPATNNGAFKQFYSRMAAGISFFSDKAGDGNMGTSQVNLSFASFVPITKKNSLSFGLQGSVVQRTLDFSKLVFPDQYTGSVYDPNVNNGENIASQNFIYPDFATGFNWSYGYSEKAAVVASNPFKANLGASIYHVNAPKQKYLSGSEEKLNRKYVLHADFLIFLKGTNVAIAPSCLLQFQGPSQEIISGMLVKYYFQEDSKYTGFIKRTTFGLGAAYRNKDALIISSLVESGHFAVGFSYDLNISKLSYATAKRGGPEIFIRFVTPNPFLFQSRAKYNLN